MSLANDYSDEATAVWSMWSLSEKKLLEINVTSEHMQRLFI